MGSIPVLWTKIRPGMTFDLDGMPPFDLTVILGIRPDIKIRSGSSDVGIVLRPEPVMRSCVGVVGGHNLLRRTVATFRYVLLDAAVSTSKSRAKALAPFTGRRVP